MFVDVSNQYAPSDSGVFDYFQQYGLRGVGDDADTPAEIEEQPPVTIIGQCDLTHGPRVRALQEALVKENALPPDGVTGYFDAATCEAWAVVHGEPPTVETLTKTLLGAQEECASVVMPTCWTVERKYETPSWVWWGSAAAALGVGLAIYMRRRR